MAEGRIRNLVITLPPRHLKSFCVSVALPAFFWGQNPGAEIMTVSYSQGLAHSFARQVQLLMSSSLYQRLFPTRLLRPNQSPDNMATSEGGVLRATSIDGTATGLGADLLIFDDPQKAGETLSDAIRRATNRAYEETFLSRLNDPGASPTVIVMQRLHENDFVGHVTGLGGHWTILNLPAIAEDDEAYRYDTFSGPKIFRRKAGEALHPARVSLEQLRAVEKQMGPFAWAAQYQQRPAPAGGAIVKEAWFMRYRADDPPRSFDRTIQSWDTASTTGDRSSYSVCTTWGVRGKAIYLLHVRRERLEYPDLKPLIVQLADEHAANVVLIEEKASGIQLIQDLKRDGFTRVKAVKPQGDKETRLLNQTPLISNGRVFVPDQAPWLRDYLHEMVMFPNATHCDQVDSTSQALDYINNANDPYQPLWNFIARDMRSSSPQDGEIWVLKGPSPVGLVYGGSGR